MKWWKPAGSQDKEEMLPVVTAMMDKKMEEKEKHYREEKEVNHSLVHNRLPNGLNVCGVL